MGIRSCGCTCLELTEDFQLGDDVQIRTVSNSLERGEISEVRENTIVLDQGGDEFIVICCAHIVSIEPAGD
ncbi:DUF2642 domain-containing protein [Clostridium formicaceticum]|uniref:Uncharacterized protein n=1 Tax=Clostridium formicaceticum TaxID=1497 RepID=A0AAC9RJ56_9CLOT|nr:DUF2642 domain-containing protein [Clostridium formicaceticum]AOY77504.1 hypothetical protein BJL90_17570 [Clostridium formicaceticum]ARE88071.1 hypothetical protein CLFO_24720 [Clostridium formicaceticum]